jgi:branched-chain amino acid transport system ATP-binding protein
MTRDLSVRALSVAYGAVRALDGVSVDVPAGARVALLGPNGAGKTTLVRALTGMLAFNGGRVLEGSIHFGAADITGERATSTVRHGLTQIPEGRQVFKDLTVEENLQLGALARRGRAEIAADLELAFDFFPPLRVRRRGKAGLLSGGEQQMVAIARGLMSRPAVMIIDELTLGLSPRVIEDILGRLENVIDETGMSLVLVEQNARLALGFCATGYVLDRGCVALHGASDELMRNDRVRESYLGIRREPTEAA